ncbi:hypothetical protein BDBG_08938 [Blastomyces gilchristii SLH14081]|uniref:Uncharacterized protein n=1 Tax=Blastomyces gilchristii (strain SLH14081) TaxID=559298 RepID=A0A179V2Y9_BLAGS|nr:uncharacterized protein BDBG_08938 [Blastomyces gilchristii SLH14081]OAT13809.1 hypothetical protein BDBG_08938 [Blastomyces gilchristii SLH14081]
MDISSGDSNDNSRYFMLEFDAENRTDKARCTGKRRWDDSSSRDRASEGQVNDRDIWHDRMAWSSDAHTQDHQDHLQELEAGSRSPSSALEAQNMQETSTMLIARQQTQNSRILISEEEEKDISITLWTGRRQVFQIINMFRMQWIWSVSPSHVSPPPRGI